jgi:hypothetical protein
MYRRFSMLVLKPNIVIFMYKYFYYRIFAVAIEAYKWIQQQMNETGHRETIIEKVSWYEENDITEDDRLGKL